MSMLIQLIFEDLKTYLNHHLPCQFSTFTDQPQLRLRIDLLGTTYSNLLNHRSLTQLSIPDWINCEIILDDTLNISKATHGRLLTEKIVS